MAGAGGALYFVDETDLAVGRAMATVRAPVVFRGHPALPEVPLGAADEDWIPAVASAGLVVITRDKLRRLGEWEAYRSAGMGVVRIEARSNLSSWAILRLVVAAWDRIDRQRRTGGPGPWLVKVGNAGSVRVVHHVGGEAT